MSEAYVLGQRIRKVNIDYGLAARVNAEVAEENLKRELRVRKKPISGLGGHPEIQPDVKSEKSLRYKLDEWDDTYIRDQIHWIWHFNNSLQPYAMMSAADFYGIVKQIRRDWIQGLDEQREEAKAAMDKLMSSFQKGFQKWRYTCPFLLNTRISYCINKDNYFESMITHHFKSQDKAIIKQYIAEIPQYYNNRGIEVILSEARGERLMQALFDTNDDPANIISNLEFITQRTPDKIMLQVPVPTSWEDSRKKKRNRVLTMNYKPEDLSGLFEIRLDEMPGTKGYCRGVIIQEGDSL
ncbi:hypothetical protein JXB28_06475 [Candidatus Woesearchaeota archaeon]|nr:hypothetical protein [Candidatus Woesearchaeota archaeon]